MNKGQSRWSKSRPRELLHQMSCDVENNFVNVLGVNPGFVAYVAMCCVFFYGIV